MNISRLPTEVLLLIIANLRLLDLKSLALTFNKTITNACLPLLEPLSEKVRNEKYIASRFHHISKLDFVDVESLECRGSLAKLWRLWIDAWDPLESDAELPRLESIDLASGTMKGQAALRRPSTPLESLADRWRRWIDAWDPLEGSSEMPSLESLDDPSGSTQEVPTALRRPSSLFEIEKWQRLHEKAHSLDIEIPSSFVTAMSDKEIIQQMGRPDGCHVDVTRFTMLAARMTRGGSVGYILPFLHHPNLEWTWSLYLEPGAEHRNFVLRIDNVARTTNVDDVPMWEILRSMITNEDVDIATRQGVSLELMDPDNIHLAGYSFQEWLAHRLFNGWLPPPTADETKEIESRARKNAPPEATLRPAVSKKAGRKNWFRRILRR